MRKLRRSANKATRLFSGRGLIAAHLAHGRANVIALIVLVIAAGVGAWWYFAPDTLPGIVKQQLPVSAKSNPLLYRWHDAKGGLHITDVPPTIVLMKRCITIQKRMWCRRSCRRRVRFVSRRFIATASPSHAVW
jgi:hypothetical protein